MPSEWQRSALGGVLSTLIDHRGRTPKKLGGDFTTSGIRVISAKNMKDGRLDLASDVRFVTPEMYDAWMPEKLRAGDVLLTSEAPLGEVAYLGDDADFCLSQRLFALRANPRVLVGRFLYYTLRSASVQVRLHARATGTTAQGIRQSELVKVEIDLPPLSVQRAIARILGALDDKIELNRKMNETLEAMARAVFKSWFVDFEPFRGKGMVDSELGPIPKGWGVESLEQHVEAVKGLSYKGAFLAGSEGVPMHNLNSVYEGGGYKYEGLKRYVGEYREKHKVRPGDLIVTNTEQGFEYLLIGYPAIVPRCFGPTGIYTHHIYRVRSLPSSPLKTHFLHYMLMAPLVREQVIGCSNGTTVNMLSADGLRVPKVVVPPAELVDRFEDVAAPAFTKMEAHHVESTNLAPIRDVLLPKLMSGEVRIRTCD